jgi:nucleoside-triphosphatase
MTHLFLTGQKGAGKSTLIRGLLAEETGRLGGFFTVRHEGGVYLLPAAKERTFTPESLLFRCGHGGDPARFDDLGCAALADTAGCRLLVMDELGPHEEAALRFQAAVFRTLDGSTPILGVLQQAQSQFLDRIARHPRVTVLTVTEENRNTLAAELRRWRNAQT